MGKKRIDYPATLAFRGSGKLADTLKRLGKEYQLRVSDVLREFLPPERLLATFLDCLDELTDEPWALCREFIERGIRDKMLNDQFWPISRAEFIGKIEGEALYRLFSEWTKGQSGLYEGYKLLAVTEDGVTRYKIERPAPAKPKQPASVPIGEVEAVTRKMLKMANMTDKEIDSAIKRYKDSQTKKTKTK